MSDNNSNDDYSNSNTNIEYNFYDEDLFLYVSIPISIIVVFIFAYFIFFTNSENKRGITFICLLILCVIWIPYAIHKYNISQEEEEAKRKQKLDANAICVKDNPCKNDSVCNSYGPNLQQYTCDECPAEWEGKNCDEIASHVITDERCLKENGDKIPNIEYCNSCEHDGECTDDIKWQNGKLVNPLHCVGDEFCKCVHTDRFTIDCPRNRDGDINELYNPYGCDVLNHEVWCPMSVEDNKPKCVIRNYPINPGKDCAESVIGQSGLCHDIYGKHNSYWSDRKTKCIVDCDDNEVYNYHKDKCEYYDKCINASESNCSGIPYCKWSDNKCEMTDEKHCISMNEDKCTEHGDSCEWKKVGKGNHKHHACIDKVTAPPPPPPTVVAHVVPVVAEPTAVVPPSPRLVQAKRPIVPKKFPSKSKKINERIKTTQPIKIEGFVVGGLAEV